MLRTRSTVISSLRWKLAYVQSLESLVWQIHVGCIGAHIVCECVTCFLFDRHPSFCWGEVRHRVLPVGGEECVSNRHVHRPPVTLPYAPAVGLLITSVCDSHTAKAVRTRRLGSGGWRWGRVNFVFSWVRVCMCARGWDMEKKVISL